MTARPWMPLYIADYLADTAHLNAAQSGAYLHLIMHYWQTGSLPDNDQALMRIARMTAVEWKHNRNTIAGFFLDGWKHKRIDSELAHVADVSSKRRASALQKKSNSSAKAERKDTHARGLSQPQSQQKEEAAQPRETVSRETSSIAVSLDALEGELRKAAGLGDDPSPSLLNPSPMIALIEKGYDLARDILPKLREMAAAGKRGSTWLYYVKAIEGGKRVNDAIKPNGTSNEPDRRVSTAERAAASMVRVLDKGRGGNEREAGPSGEVRGDERGSRVGSGAGTVLEGETIVRAS